MTPVAEKLYKKVRTSPQDVYAMQVRNPDNGTWKFFVNERFDQLPYFSFQVNFFDKYMLEQKQRGRQCRVVQVVTAFIDPDMENPIVYKTIKSM